MSFFEFQSSSKASGKIIDNPVLYSDSNPEVYILVDKLLSEKRINLLRKIIRNKSGKDISVCILYIFKTAVSKKELEKNILEYIIDNGINLSNYIPKNSRVIAMGRGLYSTTLDTSIQLSSFYDIVWNDTKFYSPLLKSWIFPVADFFSLYDTTENKMTKSYNLHHFSHQLKYVIKTSNPGFRIPSLSVEKIKDTNEFFEKHKDQKEVAWDLETTGLNCTRDDVICITMSFDGRTGYYMDWGDVDILALDQFLEDKYQIGANLKFDCRFLRFKGMKNPIPHFDTMHAGHCLNEMRSNSLKTHSWIYTYYGGYEKELDDFKRRYRNTKSYGHIPKDILSSYAAKDAIITFQVHKEMKNHLAKDPPLESYFYEHVMPTVQMFTEIESEGVFINWDNIRKAEKDLRSQQNQIAKKIFKEAGFEFDLNSSQKIAEVFENKLKFPFLGTRNKAGLYFTNEEHLNEWSKKGYKVADYMLEYRGVSALLNTFIGSEEEKTAYWEYKSEDGRVYPNFQVMMAKSHRNKANSPNLQQVPHHGDKAWMIRSFFDVPSEDYYISEFDYSGLQLRIAAIISGDKNMADVFINQSGDMHSMTAVSVFNPEMTLEEFLAVKKENPYNENRFSSKSINFGFLFGMVAFTFSNDLRKEWTIKQCKDFIKEKNLSIIQFNKTPDYYLTVATYMRDIFFETYPGLSDWHEYNREFAEVNGYVRYTHGGRRLLPELLSIGDDRKLEANLKNIALNSPVQNFEIVMISRSMRAIHNKIKELGLKSRIWATVHDAITFYIHKDEVEIMNKLIFDEMTRQYEEFRGIVIEIEGDLSDPRNSENPSYWGYGKDWEKIS